MNKSRNLCFFTKDFDLYCALNKMQLLISFFNHKRFAKCSCQTGHDIIIIITFMYLALILDIMTSVIEYQFRKFGCYLKWRNAELTKIGPIFTRKRGSKFEVIKFL